MSEYIEEAISEAELMLCPKGLPHTGIDNRAEHGHHDCWVIGELLNEIERLRTEVARLDQPRDQFVVTINANKGKNFNTESIAEIIVRALRGD